MRTFPLLALALASCAVVTAVACSDDRPPGASETTPAPPSSDAGGTVAPSVIDDGGAVADGGSTDADVADGDAGPLVIDCQTATQTGEIVQAISLLGAAPSTPGGTITPGAYVLSSVYEYRGDTDAGDGVSELDTDDYAQKTLVLSATGAFHFIEASGHGGTVGAAVVSGGTWTESNGGLVLKSTCPAPSTSQTLPFFAAGRNLYLYRPQQETYVIQP